MKLLFLSGAALLLLLTLDARADERWAGPYIGAAAGYSFGNASVTDTTGGVKPGPFDYSPSGFVGSAVAGYNLQVGGLVLGVEGDLGYLDLSGKGRIPSSNPAAHQDITLDGGLYGDITARAGVVLNKDTLVFAKGGFVLFDGEAGQKTTNPGYVTHATGAFQGYLIGGGIEHLVSDNVALRLEYDHLGFGSEGGDQTSVGDPPIGYVYKNRTELSAELIKAAVVYKF